MNPEQAIKSVQLARKGYCLNRSTKQFSQLPHETNFIIPPSFQRRSQDFSVGGTEGGGDLSVGGTGRRRYVLCGFCFCDFFFGGGVASHGNTAASFAKNLYRPYT